MTTKHAMSGTLQNTSVIHVLYLYSCTFSYIINIYPSVVSQDLLWACVLVILSPTVSNKTSPHVFLGFVLENLIKPLGSNCFPLHVYERFVQNFKLF